MSGEASGGGATSRATQPRTATGERLVGEGGAVAPRGMHVWGRRRGRLSLWRPAEHIDELVAQDMAHAEAPGPCISTTGAARELCGATLGSPLGWPARSL